MLRPRFRRLWLLLALPLVPVICWLGLLAVVPTEWARARIAAQLAESTGRPVRIGTVRLGLTGALTFQDLTIAEKATAADPWLRVAQASVDVHLVQLLSGCCQPTEIDVDGVALRILRRADGTLEFGELLAGSDPKAKPSDSDSGTSSHAVHLNIKRGRMIIIDEAVGLNMDLSDVEGQALYEGKTASVPKLEGNINGGTFAFAAKFDKTNPTPRYETELIARGVSLDAGMSVLGFLAPVISDATDSVDGRVSLRLALKGEGVDGPQLLPSLKGYGSIAIDPIDLDGSALLNELSVIKEIPRQGRVGSVTSDFAVEKRRVISDNLTIKVAGLPLVLAGWTDFDGNLDYKMRSDKLTSKIPKEARGILSELDLDLKELMSLRVHGTMDKVQVDVDGRSVAGDKKKLKDTAKRLREHLMLR